MSKQDYLSELNEAQRKAVLYNDGPSLIIAGAGSGKTRVLVYKVIHLLHSSYRPERIMALTFTNKAAREMKSRIEETLPNVGHSLIVGTFHSVFMRVLRQHAELLGYTSNFTIYDTNDTKSLVKKLVKGMGLDPKTYTPKALLARFSRAKNAMITPEAYRKDNKHYLSDQYAGIPRAGEVYALYCKTLQESNAMDFDDLLFLTNILFQLFPDVLEYWQERIDYLLIDEYQDTNQAQYLLTKSLMQKKGKIFVVGDDAQSIYSFRGANIENILGFEKTFANTKVFKLEQNYRSTQTIVRAAGEVIKNNKRQMPKEVFSEGAVGDKIELHQSYSGMEEANWVAESIFQAKASGKGDYSDFAVLYRANSQSRLFEQVFLNCGIPFKIRGGRSFFDRKEIRDILAYFRLIVNPNDEEALLRVINYPKRGIGQTTIDKVLSANQSLNLPLLDLCRGGEKLGLPLGRATFVKLRKFADLIDEMVALAQSETNLYALAQSIIAMSGIPQDLKNDNSTEGENRYDNLQELIVSIGEYQQNKEQEEAEDISLSTFLNEISLMTDRELKEQNGDNENSVSFMTIHSAKGLEFPHVYLVGLEEGLFPSNRALSEEKQELEKEEERRLFYVALTRAEKTCHISCARFRYGFKGAPEESQPSSFIGELPKELLKGKVSLVDKVKSNSGLKLSWQEMLKAKTATQDLPTNFSTKADDLLSSPNQKPKRSSFAKVSRRRVTTPDVKQERIGDLSIGSRVEHTRFGQGKVLELEGEGTNAKAIVLFDEDGTKRNLLLRFAKLKVID